MSWGITQPGDRGARLFRTGECSERECHPAPELRNEFWARLWLREFKGDSVRMGTLRQMLARESTGSNTHRASDDALINEAVRLLTAGVWHVHAADFTQSTAGTSTAGSSTAPATGKWKRAAGTARPRPPSLRKNCRLKTPYGNCLIIRKSDLAAGEEYLEHTASAPLEIAELTRGLEAQGSLQEIQQTFSGVRGAIPGATGVPAARAIENALRSGALVLIRDKTAAGGGGGGAGEGAGGGAGSGAGASSQAAVAPGGAAARAGGASSTGAAQPAPEKTWFRMQLLDEDGQPMAGEDYKVVDSAGASHQGKLDDSGQFYIPPTLPPGNCTISFPNIHLNPRKKKKA